MKIQIIGLGNIGKSLLALIQKEKEALRCLGVDLRIVSISDSRGTAVDELGLDPGDVLRGKSRGWSGFKNYVNEMSSLDAIREVWADTVVELTPSTKDGEPGLSHIKAALKAGKNVVTANKGPFVVAFDEIAGIAHMMGVNLMYEATVSAQLPVFCLLDSCFIADRVLKLEGVLNATTNFIIGEIESGKSFSEALEYSIKAGWAEADYSDDVDGVDSARKLVILANRLCGGGLRLEDVHVQGIRGVEAMVVDAKKLGMRVKLLCEMSRGEKGVSMNVSPKMIPLDDPIATIKEGNMGVKYTFRNSQEVFASVQFNNPEQAAYAVLNDIIKTDK